MKFAAGNMYAAGVESTEVVVLTFLIMVVHNPEVVKRAQARIDKFIGSERLPTLADRHDLPYIDCISKEVFRINPPFPLVYIRDANSDIRASLSSVGLLHRSMKKDVYKGRTVPARSIIMPNIWQMIRDERYYADPEKIIPERFLKKFIKTSGDYVHTLKDFNPGDPSSLVFGFRKGICPARFFADAGARLVIANILAILDILPFIDPDTGKKTLPSVEYITGFASKPGPKPFNCRIVPLSAKHALLIEHECA